MTPRMQQISQLDRVIHEPARLAIMLILGGAGDADFLYLQRRADSRKATCPGISPNWRKPVMSRLRKNLRAKCR